MVPFGMLSVLLPVIILVLAFSSFQELAQLDHSCGQYMLGVYFYYRY
jgi:hypothetical protein